jgi:hypothetical protein
MTLPGIHSRRAVCFLDILGFRRMLEQKPLIEIAETYDRFISAATSLNRSFPITSSDPQLFPNHPAEEPYCIRYVFSDSLILIARDDDATSCLKLLVHAWRLVQATLAQRMSVRGAVACGEMYFDPAKGICLGHGLTAAYELEQKQNWVGVAIDSSVERAYPELFPSGLHLNSIYESLFLRYPVPLKGGGVIEVRTLNWRWNLIVEHGTRWLFPSSEDAPAQEKITNTLAYAERVVKSGCVYASDQRTCPAELRAFWVGGREPPFPHGDEL